MLPKTNRRVVIVRHGERVDHRFQDAWVDNCFDNEGNYTRQNLNQPESLPMREGYPRTFLRDSPLTAVGCHQATLRGQGIQAAKLLKTDDDNSFVVYVSPSLRCVKTAANVLKGMNVKNAVMCVESCLFEWTSVRWYLNGNMPSNWMTPEELSKAGFNINLDYIPFMKREEMKEGETPQDYYERSFNLLTHLINNTDNKDLLLVCHGFSFDALTRKLLGKPVLTTEQELSNVAGVVPYCGMMILEERDVIQHSSKNKWNIQPLPKQLQLVHKSAHEFDACKVFV